MKRFIAVVSLVLSVAACSDSDKATGPDEITIADLVGSWTAASLVFTNNADPGQTFDVVAAGGETRMTVLDHGGARIWFTLGDFSDEWDAQLGLSGNTLSATPAEATRSARAWTVSLDGNVLTLTDENASFDFTLNGGAEIPVTEVVVFVRQ